MSETAPRDLAVAFRSLPRRLREAADGVAEEVAAGLVIDAHNQLAEAARLLGTTADGEAVAAAIEAVAADQWDDSVLDALRQAAINAGRAVRQIEDQRDS
jgi:hypothetical protein